MPFFIGVTSMKFLLSAPPGEGDNSEQRLWTKSDSRNYIPKAVLAGLSSLSKKRQIIRLESKPVLKMYFRVMTLSRIVGDVTCYIGP